MKPFEPAVVLQREPGFPSPAENTVMSEPAHYTIVEEFHQREIWISKHLVEAGWFSVCQNAEDENGLPQNQAVLVHLSYLPALITALQDILNRSLVAKRIQESGFDQTQSDERA